MSQADFVLDSQSTLYPRKAIPKIILYTQRRLTKATDEGRLAKTPIQFKIIKCARIRKGGTEYELNQDFGNISWLVHDHQFWNLAIGCTGMDTGDSIH